MSDDPRPRIRTRASRPAGVPADSRPRPLPPKRAPSKPLLDYRLCILTNGRPCLRETIEAFRWRVTPTPAEVVVFDDGGTQETHKRMTAWHAIPAKTVYSSESLGFCRATRALWREASKPGPEFVWWLEDDQVIQQKVDVEAMAEVLRANPRLAQMGLMRQPVNSEEIAAGGCRALRPDQYEERDGWLESTTNFSTGCSLIRREFMLDQPWPSYDHSCEGRYSIELLAKGYKFAVWGLGEPWVKHVGVRSGHGY